MALSVRIDFLGDAAFRRMLEAIRPSSHRAVLSEALTESAMLVARIAALEKIRRGGRFRGPRGPRGGLGALSDAAAHPTMLTSRSGRLRGSLAGRGFRAGIDDSRLPREIAVGSDVSYAAVHEFGGSFSQTVARHVRTSAFGRETRPFVVREHTRSVSFRPRPFLKPALDDASRQFEDVFVRAWDRAAARGATT